MKIGLNNNLTFRIKQKWFRRKRRSFAKWLFLRAIYYIKIYIYITSIATILNFKLDITFNLYYEIWIFHIR